MTADHLTQIMHTEQLRATFDTNLRQIVALHLDVHASELEAYLDWASPGLHAPKMPALTASFAGLAQACRPDLPKRSAVKWLRRELTPGRDLSWTRLSCLSMGLGVEVSWLFEQRDSPVEKPATKLT